MLKRLHVLLLKLKEDLQAKEKVIKNISRNYKIIETEYSKLKANHEGHLQEIRMETEETELNEAMYEEKD